MAKVELKNVQHNARMSEETHCFSATVYIDGIKAGEVSNRGHGGPDEFHPHELVKRLDEIAKLQLKPVVIEGYTIEPDAEILVGDLVNRWLTERDAKRLLKERICGVDAAGNLIQSGKLAPAALAKWTHPDNIAQTKQKLGLVEVFLSMIDLADAIYALNQRSIK